MSKKLYILDTCVCIYDPDCIFKFEENDIIIPIVVIKELDKIKIETSERGYNARKITRQLDDLRTKHGSLIDWQVINKENGRICIKLPENKLNPQDPFDDQILAIAIEQKKYTEYESIALVTLDTNLRLKADAYGLGAQSYINPEIKDVNTNNILHIKDINFDITDIANENGICCPIPLLKNQCVVLHKQDGQTILAREKKGKLKIIKDKNLNIKPRNINQRFALEMLFDPDISLVTLQGVAGSGKSLLSLMSGLCQAVQGKYSKFLITKPIIPFGKDLGFLPGPQPLDAKILTPVGWTTMGQLKIGDEVISRDGKPTKILGIFPKGEKEVYKLTTTDETSTECCEDHLWYTQTLYEKSKKTGSVKTTKDINNTLFTKKRKNNVINHILPRNEAVEYYQREELPIPPYTLGAMLGDGCFYTRHPSFSNTDNEIIERVSEELKRLDCCMYITDNKYEFGIKNTNTIKRYCKAVKITNTESKEFIIYESLESASECLKQNIHSIKRRCYLNLIKDGYFYEFITPINRWGSNIKEQLEKLNLLGHRAWDKFIPDLYKYSSVDNRLNLLRGLMDTDGSVSKTHGAASFTTTSKQLALDVIEVVKSLGGRAVLRSRNRIGQKSKFNNITTRRITYEFALNLPNKFNPFFITRKASFYNSIQVSNVGIKSIEFVGKKPVQCISIDNPEHLYITDNFIVTHNTVEEKMQPWIKPLNDNIEIILMSKMVSGCKNIEDLYRQGILEIEALTYIRGRSIPRQIILIDESQNTSPSEMRTILTRVGEGAKIILSGDCSQIDNPLLNKFNNGLTHVINKLKNEEFVANIVLEKGERSSLANLAAEKL